MRPAQRAPQGLHVLQNTAASVCAAASSVEGSKGEAEQDGSGGGGGRGAAAAEGN